jgi:hypothetical protein
MALSSARRPNRSQLDALEQAEVRGRELGLSEHDENLAQFAGQLALRAGQGRPTRARSR